MAKTSGGLMAEAAQKKQGGQIVSALGSLINTASVQQRFEKMLGKKSSGFLSSLLTLVNSNSLLVKADPRSVLAAAATAAALDLPINPTLGKAWIVPYGGRAQFQIGYRGIIELAQRSGRMKFITMTPVYEGEIADWNRFTETFTAGEKSSDVVVGYFASFELVNGFKKSAYWTKDEVLRHAKRFSKSFGSGPWQTDFDAMACKTVLLSIMKTYAPMSIEMQNAVEADEKVAVIDDASGGEEFIDIEMDEAQEGKPQEKAEAGKAASKWEAQAETMVDPATGEVVMFK